MQARQAAASQAQGMKLPDSATKRASRDPRPSPEQQEPVQGSQPSLPAAQKGKSAQPIRTQPAESSSGSEASASSDRDSAEEEAIPIIPREKASRPATRSQVSKGREQAEQEESGNKHGEAREAEHANEPSKAAAGGRADRESESWHSLEEERPGQGASPKVVHSTPQSRKPSPKALTIAAVSTPVPIEPATGANCLPSHSGLGRRSLPVSLQEGFLWSPDQAGVASSYSAPCLPP